MTFDEWFNEIESFSLRCERFYNDLDHHIEGSEGSNKRMVEWLKAAYEQGRQDGADAQASKNSGDDSGVSPRFDNNL